MRFGRPPGYIDRSMRLFNRCHNGSGPLTSAFLKGLQSDRLSESKWISEYQT